MGVPCITLAGQCHAHNVGKSLLTAIGLCDGWLAHSRQEYVQLARARAADLEQLAALRSHLRDDVLASSLCQAEPFLANLEEKYRECFDRWRQGVGAGSSGGSSATGEHSGDDDS
jgi:predicted O-linked N-acetylglucosamine transferase (SPINDLY family)